MPSFGSETGNVLYLIVCGAPLAANTPQLVKEKQAEGWDVCVVTTPHGAGWIDVARVEVLTGHEVRTHFRQPRDEPFAPLGDAVLVSPATFNTINKFALGVSDTLALGLMNEALGRGVPLALAPQVNEALASHPAYQASLDRLVGCGVVIMPEGECPDV